MTKIAVFCRCERTISQMSLRVHMHLTPFRLGLLPDIDTHDLQLTLFFSLFSFLVFPSLFHYLRHLLPLFLFLLLRLARICCGVFELQRRMLPELFLCLSMGRHELWTEKLDKRLREAEHKQTSMTTLSRRGLGEVCVCFCVFMLAEGVYREKQEGSKCLSRNGTFTHWSGFKSSSTNDRKRV